MNYTTYVLQSCKDGRHYVGSTKDLQKRLEKHNRGECLFTRNRRPWELIYHEVFSTRSGAVKRERFFKSGDGRNQLKKLLVGTKRVHSLPGGEMVSHCPLEA